MRVGEASLEDAVVRLTQRSARVERARSARDGLMGVRAGSIDEMCFDYGVNTVGRRERVAWWVLLVVSVLMLAFPLLDAVGILRAGIPADHAAAFQTLAGQPFSSSTGPAHYIRQLEWGYAIHELTFGLFFLVIVAIPLRAGQRWAWWACWIVLIANVGYTVTLAHFSANTLIYSLIPDLAIPALLLLQLPLRATSVQAAAQPTL